MAGCNGGRGSSWSYRQETVGSNVSSSSGTIVSRLSTAYTSSSSRFSTLSMEAVAMHFDSLRIYEEHNGDDYDGDSKTWYWEEVAVEDRMDHIRSLVKEFFSAASANCSIKVGDMSVVERWLTELGVGWVLCLELDGGVSAEAELYGDARSWIRALKVIVQTICSMTMRPDRGSVGLPSICEEEQGDHVAERCIPDQYHLVLFVQETMLKMLAFLDVVVAWDPNTRGKFPYMDRVTPSPSPYNKLITLLSMHDALCGASNEILTLFDSPATCVEVQRIENRIVVLLSTNKGKAGEAVRSTMEKIRTKSMEDDDDSSSSLNQEGSSDIHKVTRSVITFIRFLLRNYSLVDAAIPSNYVPRIENVRALDSMIMDMVSCLQEKLATISQSISDQGLRFLLLFNNSYIIQNSQPFYYLDLNDQIEGHMERYLQVSWAPLLSCLFNHMPLCLAKNYSLLSKFESEFQQIYATQKEWKVPDPRLRRWLRKVITDKIIPCYTEYIEDNKVTNPKFSPQELKAMLQELFEG